MEKENKLSIKETLDVFNFLNRLLSEMAEAVEDDGKVSLMEMIEAAIQVSPMGVKALSGSGEIHLELKELSEEELNEIVAQTLNVVQKTIEVSKRFAAS